MKIGFIAGNFDILHYGHIETINKVKNLVDVLYVLVNTDAFSKRYKRACIMTQEERIRTLKAVYKKEETIRIELNIGEEDTTKTIDEILTHEITDYDNIYIFHGADWTGEALKKQMGITNEWLEKRKCTMLYYDRSGNISTSDIINRIKS